MEYSLQSFEIKNFRSIKSVKVDFLEGQPVVLCGKNNVGKTNVLRALNIFFNYHNNRAVFNAEIDFPFNLSSRSKLCELSGHFKNINDPNDRLLIDIKIDGDETPEYYINGVLNELKSTEALEEFKYIFVESGNVNVPDLIASAIDDDFFYEIKGGRGNNGKAQRELQSFIRTSKQIVSNIEATLNNLFSRFNDSITTNKIKIKFAEFDELREAIKSMVTVTLDDGNNLEISQKGNGHQRIVFLTLLDYLSNNTKKTIIWGIDEPETFLHPKLQRDMSTRLYEIATKKSQQIILTTHSQYFINFHSLDSSHVVDLAIEVKKNRNTIRGRKQVFSCSTKLHKGKTGVEKLHSIRESLGLLDNDGWAILPYNLIVEGTADVRYLQILLEAEGLPIPKIISAHGATKVHALLSHYDSQSKSHNFHPFINCIFDCDTEGVDAKRRITPSKFSNLTVKAFALPSVLTLESTELTCSSIEDFLPHGLLLEIINEILVEEDYEIISAKQVRERTMKANITTSILRYAENCVASNNPRKPRLPLENRKMSICSKFCDSISPEKVSKKLKDTHKDFLKKIVKFS